MVHKPNCVVTLAKGEGNKVKVTGDVKIVGAAVDCIRIVIPIGPPQPPPNGEFPPRPPGSPPLLFGDFKNHGIDTNFTFRIITRKQVVNIAGIQETITESNIQSVT